MSNEIKGLVNITTGIGIPDADARYTLLTTTSSISGSLNSRLTTVESNYATKTTPTSGTFNNITVNSQGVVISGSNVSYLTSASIPTSATFLTDYDARYVNVTGDTMTGTLVLSAATSGASSLHIVQGIKPTVTVDGDIWSESRGVFFQNNSSIHQMDADSNSVGAMSKTTITVTDSGSKINATSIDVFIYSQANWTGDYSKYTVPAITGMALVDNSVNYLVVDYNSGSPIFTTTTNPVDINGSNKCLAATLWREGTDVHWTAVDWGLSTGNRLNDRQINIQRYERSSGLALSTTGSVIDLTSGVIWYGVTANSKLATSSSPSNCYFYYHTSLTTWGRDTVSGWNNTYYDTGSARATLGNNNYTVNWVYRYVDGDSLPHLAFILGGEHSNIASAVAEKIPSSIPPILQRMAILVGRIIVQQGNSTAIQTDSAFTQIFTGSSVTQHNNLGGIQGGAVSEYYHHTLAQYNDFIGKTEVASISGGLVSLTGNQTISGQKTFTSSMVISATSGHGILLDTTAPTFGWRDITGQIIPDTAGTAPVKAAFRGGTIGAYVFGAGDQCDIPFHIPHDYVPGTDVYAHVHWSHNGTSIAGNAVFTITATTAKGFNQAIFPAEKSQTITYNTTNIATTPRYIHRVDEIQLSNNGGTGNFINTNDIEVDGLILLNVTMTTLPTIGGGSPNEVFIFQIDLHYQSTNLSTKNKAPSFYP